MSTGLYLDKIGAIDFIMSLSCPSASIFTRDIFCMSTFSSSTKEHSQLPSRPDMGGANDDTLLLY